GNTYEFKIFVRKGTEWTGVVSVFEKPLDITVMNPGDLMIMAVNTNFDNDPIIDANQPLGNFEEFTFVCFQAIKVGTPIDFTDNGWEREYDNKWGTSEGTIRLTRTAGGTLAAGTTVTVVMNSGDGGGGSGTTAAHFDIFVAGVDELASNWTIGWLNQSDGSGFNLNGEDDIWIMQNGSWIENTTGGAPDPAYHDDEYTGNILFGWTATGWPGADAAGSTAFSNLYPYSDCFQTDISGASNNDKVKYSGAMTSATQLEWIARVNDTGNWTTYSSDALYDATTTNLYRQSGVTIPITPGGYTDGVWTGTQNTDWFDCGNWQSLTVPDENVDVVIGASATDNAVVDDASAEASKYDGIAKCRDLTISNQTLFIEGDVSDTLMVYGNLEISGGTLDMDDAAKAIDGHLYLYGNWDNQSGSANFKEGEGTVHFVGNGSQSISTSDATETFYNFISDNSIVSGIILNDDVRIDGAFSHNDGDIDLNGNNIDLRSTYSRTTGTFIGDASSDFSLNGSGSVADLSFINDLNLHDFTINRAGENVVVLSDLDLNNLTITAGSVTLTAGKNYDVHGTLTNTPNTAAALILKSDASGTASLIQQTGAVAATVERYLSGNNWHYIFAPLTSIDTATFTVAPWGDINPNVYFYNETVADFWQGLTTYNPTGWIHANGVSSPYLQTDRGYINYFTADKVYTQTGGNLTDADKSFTLSYTNSGTGNEPNTGTDWDNFEGWNLFGNPYVSAVDWDNAGLNKDSIENFVYYYDDTQDKYLCYGGNPPWNNNGVSINGGTQYIPAGQAFMIKSSSTANGNPFIIPKSARVHDSHSFYKKSSETQNLIRLQIKKDNYTDETIIRTLPAETNVTDEHDANYDAYKMFAWNSENPQLYSHTPENDEFFAVNSIPEITSSEVVPLGVYIGTAGEYSVEMTENAFGNMHMWLEDRTENVNTNLLNNSIYTFNQSAETNDNRFYLHFGNNTKPKLNAEIPDQEINVNDTYDYVIQPGLFTDTDFEDVLTISATLENGEALPDWLSFIPETQSFYGTP
ncbi:MAG: hypothetical protein J7K64_03530, partial [Bacteroidales bacterium]|nr:hypothetical protein [Bacteroidales bacterium]